MTLEKINFIFTIILFFLIFKIFRKLNNEKFVNIFDVLDEKPPVKSEESIIYEAIQDTYQVDLQAIQNLSDIAARIQKAGGLEIPGNLVVFGSLNGAKDINILGNVNIKGDTAVGGTLNVNKIANFKDFVNVGRDLTVDGETIINGDVYARKGYNLLN
jgi:hypothetical protein